MKTMLNTIETYIAGKSDLTDSMMRTLIQAEGKDCMTQQDIAYASQYAYECKTLPISDDREQSRIKLVQFEFDKLYKN